MERIGEYLDINAENQLTVEGHSCLALAHTYGTPLFVLSENTIRSNYKKFHRAFESRYPNEVVVCVGLKANCGLAARRIIVQEGGGGDVFGAGELYVAMLAGSDPKKIVVNGANKPDDVIQGAIQSGVIINVDSLDELAQVDRIAARLGTTVDICPRIRLPLTALKGKMYIDPRYGPPGTDVSKWESEFKFGMEPASFFEAVKRALALKHVNLKGIMYHGGIPRRAGYYKEETEELMGYVAEIREAFRWEPEIINVGGGFTPKRFGKEEPPSIDEYAEVITSVIKTKAKEHGVSVPALYLEPGRWVWENAAVYLVRVGSIKEDTAAARKKWVYVDGNVNHMHDPFDRFVNYRHLIVANKPDASLEEVVDVCGQLCNAADILAKDRKIPKVERGDILAFLDMGAYCESFANQANAMPRPASVLVSEHNVAIVRERETIQDVLSRDRVPFWLM